MNVLKNMEPTMTKFPFEAGIDEILDDVDVYIDSVFSCLESAWPLKQNSISTGWSGNGLKP